MVRKKFGRKMEYFIKNGGVDGYSVDDFISKFNGMAYWDNGNQYGHMEILEWDPPVELNVI